MSYKGSPFTGIKGIAHMFQSVFSLFFPILLRITEGYVFQLQGFHPFRYRQAVLTLWDLRLIRQKGFQILGIKPILIAAERLLVKLISIQVVLTIALASNHKIPDLNRFCHHSAVSCEQPHPFKYQREANDAFHRS